MADGRQRAEWERACWLMGWVGRFSGGDFGKAAGDLYRLRFGEPEPPRREPTKEETDLAFELFGKALKGG